MFCSISRTSFNHRFNKMRIITLTIQLASSETNNHSHQHCHRRQHLETGFSNSSVHTAIEQSAINHRVTQTRWESFHHDSFEKKNASGVDKVAIMMQWAWQLYREAETTTWRFLSYFLNFSRHSLLRQIINLALLIFYFLYSNSNVLSISFFKIV